MRNQVSGLVFDIAHYMIEDGPGIRTTVFFKGCPLSCKWCSNAYGLDKKIQMAYRKEKCMGCGACIPVCKQNAIIWDKSKTHSMTNFSACIDCLECVDVCLTDARTKIGKIYTVSEVLREVEKDKKYYRRGGGGITLSGGEILLQSEFAYQILYECHERMINTAIETSACGLWENLKRLILCCDTVFIDCKCVDRTLHKLLTGADNQRVLENIIKAAELCDKEQIQLIVRMPLIPELNDSQEHIMDVAWFVMSLKGNVSLNILPYHNYGGAKYEHIGKKYLLDKIKIPDKRYLENVSKVLQITGVNYSIGGYNIE